MSLPIVLAIVLTAAILAWAAAYLIVRKRRAAALSRALQSNPIDAEIGREALRRVFGILADEDLAPSPTSPTPIVASPAEVPAAASADREPAPTTLAPLAAAAALLELQPEGAPEPASVTPAEAGAPVVAEPAGYQLFAPADGEVPAPARSLLPTSTAVGGRSQAFVYGEDDLATPETMAAASGGRPPGSPGGSRPRFVRDTLGALAVTGAILVLAVLLFHPQLGGGVPPATASAPAIGDSSEAPSVAPSLAPVVTPSPSPSPTASPSPSSSPSPSPSPSPSATPIPTAVPTPKPTPRPTPVPTATPTPTPTPKPTPKPTATPPVIQTFTVSSTSISVGASVSFSGTWLYGTSWQIDFGDGSAVKKGSLQGLLTTHVYNAIGDFTPTLTIFNASGSDFQYLTTPPQAISVN